MGEVSRLLYVASTVSLNVSQIQQLHQQRFSVMSKARFTLEMQPDVASAVDLFVCRRAALYAGNMFSAFSCRAPMSKTRPIWHWPWPTKRG